MLNKAVCVTEAGSNGVSYDKVRQSQGRWAGPARFGAELLN